MIGKVLNKSGRKSGTHAHYAGEFGLGSISHLQKSAVFHAARVEKAARLAKTASEKHRTATNVSARAEHALVVAYAENIARRHAGFAQTLAPGSAHAARAASALEKVKKIHENLQARASTGDQKATQKIKPPTSKEISAEQQQKNISKPATPLSTASGVQTEKSMATTTPIPTMRGGKAMSDEQFETHRKKFAQKLTEDEHRASHAYTEEAYMGVNDALRSGNLPKHYEKMVSHVDSVISKSSMPEDTKVFRGAGGDNVYEHYSKLKPGDAYIEKAFSSTSAKEGQAFQNVSRVVMHVTIPRGGKGAALPSASPSEREVLLPRGQKFIVDHVEHGTLSNGKSKVTLHVTATQE